MRLPLAAFGAALALLGCAHTPAPRGEIARLEDRREPGAERLMALAQHGDPAIRRQALRALARLQDPASLPALERALGDPEPAVRDEAAFAMETLGLRWEGLDEVPRQRAEQAVLRALATAPAARQEALLRALGTLAREEGAQQLVERLGSTEPQVARAAALALGTWIHRGQASTAPAWPAPGAAAQLSSPAAQDPAARRAVAYALLRAAPKRTDAAFGVLLLAGLADDDPEVRALSAKGLAAWTPLEDSETIERLGQLATTDPDWRVRVEAVRALAAAGATAHGAAAAERLERALLALARDAVAPSARPDPRAIMPLWAAWDSAVPYSSRAAAEQALPLFEEARKMANGPRRFDLARLACAAAAARDRAAKTIDALRRCGGDSIAPRERDRRVARTLGAIQDPTSVEALAVLLVSVDPGTRSQAAESLGLVAAALEKAHRTSDQGDRGEPGGPGDRSGAGEPAQRARALLRAALRDTDGPVVASAAEALGQLMDTESAAGLLDALARFSRPADNELTQSILAGLGAIHAAAAAPVLRRLLTNSSPPVRLAARKALTMLGETAPASVQVDPPEPLPAAAYSQAQAQAQSKTQAQRRLRLTTDKGEIVILLAVEDAPITTAVLARLVARGYYDGLTFHRVVPDFVAQGGDPRGDGWGGPGFNLRCELSPRRYLRGTVGMALAGKDTGGSQFFITHSMQPHLDGKYTVIGEVVAGMEVVDALLPGDRILRATLSR